jgi:hypothetical protein
MCWIDRKRDEMRKQAMHSLRKAAVVLVAVALPCWGVLAQSLPATEGVTLSGKPTTLARDVSGKPAVVVIGFSKASSSETAAWAKRLKGDAGLAGMAVYQVAVLEEVPKLVRGMVKSSIRGSVPVADQGTFVMLFHDEAQWKQLAHYGKADDAYVVVLDRSGTTRFTAAGAVADHYGDVVEAAKRVLQP